MLSRRLACLPSTHAASAREPPPHSVEEREAHVLLLLLLGLGGLPERGGGGTIVNSTQELFGHGVDAALGVLLPEGGEGPTASHKLPSQQSSSCPPTLASSLAAAAPPAAAAGAAAAKAEGFFRYSLTLSACRRGGACDHFFQ